MNIYKTSGTTLLKFVLGIAAVTMLSGCLISPYYGQKFSSRTTEIPFTVYTIDKNSSITIECAKASPHGGPYNGSNSYQTVATITPSSQGTHDPKGNIIYSASTKQALPSDCYRYYDYSDAYDFITVIRVLQNGSSNSIYTFDKDGLKCLGEWIGKGPDWFHWLNKGCYKTYSNTGGTIRTVFLRSKA